MTDDPKIGAGSRLPDPALCARHARRLERFLVKRPYLPTDVRASIAFAIELLERLAEAAGDRSAGDGPAAEE